MTARLDKGTTLDGRFRLDELIGAGGMGTVYAGFDLQQGHRSRSRSSMRAWPGTRASAGAS